ncbi:FapA family protein [Orenia marismortui]|uniref:Jag family protein n=1 Tax=Orenia marismortui TaxID=46469 RepID=A0A4V6QBA4_9FIRM|nr:FapA family protein [Orenia marismortui]TDX53191.1 jag family protein [Orenia marismortui]
MSKSISVIFRGESISQAIEQGLEMLECSREDVDIEVLEEGREGFLGFGKKEAKVKLTVNNRKENKEEGLDNKETIKDQNEDQNSVELKNNILSLTQEVEKRYPVIKAGEGIKLYLNQEEVDDWIILSEDKEVKVEAVDREAVSEVKIRVSEDEFSAYLTVIQENGCHFEPKLIPSSSQEYIIVAEKLEEIEAEKVELDDIYDKLSELKISYGLKHTKIQQALAETNEEVLIAAGKEPVKSKDSVIRYIFNEEKITEDDDQDKIDYFTMNQVTSVQQGELIAKKKPAVVGESGYNIFGDEIEVEAPKDIEWSIDEESVELVDNKAVALKSGRPTINKGKLSVIEVLDILGDVDMSVGNIDFNGDVIISRDVCDNFQVKATGKIIVKRNVNSAYLEAEQGVKIKGNVVGSEIIVGKLSVYYKDAYDHFRKLAERLESLNLALKELMSNQAFKTEDIKLKGYKEVIQLLISSKFSDIYKILKSLDDLNQDIEIDEVFEEMKLLIAKLKEKFNLTGICYINTLAELKDLKELITLVCNILDSIKKTNPQIIVSYIQNSKLTASGDILVTGEGVYNSQLISNARVEISGEPGFFRGGKIKADEDVKVKELGSSSGSQVEVIVPEDKKVIADKLFINTSLKIGNRRYKFQKDWEKISAHLDKSAKISLF